MHVRNSHFVAEKLYVLKATLGFQSLHCSAEIFPSAVFDLLTSLQSISFLEHGESETVIWQIFNSSMGYVPYAHVLSTA